MQDPKHLNAYAHCQHITAEFMRSKTDKTKSVLVNMTAKFLTRCLHAIQNYGRHGECTVVWKVPLEDWPCLTQYNYEDVKKVLYSVLENLRARGFNVFTIGPGVPIFFVIDWGVTKQKNVETRHDFLQDVKDARELLSQKLEQHEMPTHFNSLPDFMRFHQMYFQPGRTRVGPRNPTAAQGDALVPPGLMVRRQQPPPTPAPIAKKGGVQRAKAGGSTPKLRAPPRPCGVEQAFRPPLDKAAPKKSGLIFQDI
jgi:hypothetical protein